MRKTFSLLAATVMAAGISVSTATPASAAEYCFGAPSEPLAYVCIGLGDTTVPDPQVTWTSVPVTVTSLCYGVGCTQETTYYVPVPWVTGVTPGRPSVTIYWNGYYLPGDARYIVQEIINNIQPICFEKPYICVP